MFKLIFLVLLTWSQSLFAQAANSLSLVKKGDGSSVVILVNGINGSAKFFDEWVQSPSFENYTVYAFNVNHRSYTMTESATFLANHISELQKTNIIHLNIFAHSMGGLVAKKALDLLSASNSLDKFEQVKLATMGTPWGGFSKAEAATWLPGAKWICKLLGYPMCTEISPLSEFMTGLSVALPSNVRFEVLDSTGDMVATPVTKNEKLQYAEVVSHSTFRKTVTNLDHDQFGSIELVAASLN